MENVNLMENAVPISGPTTVDDAGEAKGAIRRAWLRLEKLARSKVSVAILGVIASILTYQLGKWSERPVISVEPITLKLVVADAVKVFLPAEPKLSVLVYDISNWLLENKPDLYRTVIPPYPWTKV